MSTNANVISFASDTALRDRLQKVADKESERNGFKVPVSAIIRKSIDIGLNIIETES